MSGMGFQQLMDVVAQNTRMVGMDIDATKKELQLIKIVQLQLMENIKNIVQTMRAHNIEVEFKSLFETQPAPQTKEESANEADVKG